MASKASKTTYAKNSLINIGSDSFVVDAGTVTRTNNGLNLGINSRCTFTKTYTDDELSADKLKVDYSLVANAVSSRYNNKIAIQLKIQYYETEYDNGEMQYTDGKWQTIEVIPYNDEENKGNYRFDEIDTEGMYVKTIKCIIRNNSSEITARLNSLGVYNSIYNPNGVVNALNEYNNGNGIPLVIPLVDVLPDINDVPDGYICRLRSIT